MYNFFIKRAIDIIVSSLLIVVTSPIMITVALLILLEGQGEILFKQDRIGKDGKSFKMYKFRTMKWDENKEKAETTKQGEFLRNTSIDEIPQFFNILKGDMSFIGPRPWMKDYLKYFTPEQKKRCKVKPGISGWAQVNGRNSLNIFKKIDYDIFYVDNVSFVTDLKILRLTIKTVFSKKGSSMQYTGVNDEINDLKDNYERYSQLAE